MSSFSVPLDMVARFLLRGHREDTLALQSFYPSSQSPSSHRANVFTGSGTPSFWLYNLSQVNSFFHRLQVYKRIGISQVRYIKGKGNRSFRYLKGPLIIIFRRDAPYGCISLFIKHYIMENKTS